MSESSTGPSYIWAGQVQSALAENLILRTALSKIFDLCTDEALPASMVPDLVCDAIHDAFDEVDHLQDD